MTDKANDRALRGERLLPAEAFADTAEAKAVNPERQMPQDLNRIPGLANDPSAWRPKQTPDQLRIAELERRVEETLRWCDGLAERIRVLEFGAKMPGASINELPKRPV